MGQGSVCEAALRADLLRGIRFDPNRRRPIDRWTLVPCPTGTGPTGYTVTFRYFDGNPATHNVKVRGEWYFSDAAHTSRTTSAGRLPSAWLVGDFPIANPNSGAAANWPIHPMTQDPDTLVWSFTTPMPSGTYTYGFLRNCTNANFGSSTGCSTSTEISDPMNPPWNTSGSVEPDSEVYVPSDPAFGTVNMSWEAPNPVHSTLLDLTYPDPESTSPVGLHYLAVCTPPGYNASRVPAYPTLYLSHGSGGNEVDWSTQGVACNIIDNLLAAGKIQPMVVVMTNFNGLPNGVTGYRNDVVNRVIPFVQANFNVSHNPFDRAFAGLSAGGQRANDILFNATTTFGSVASWSIGTSGTPATSSPLWNNPDLKTRLSIHIGGGLFDSISASIPTYEATMTAHGIPFVDDQFNAGHEWYTWRQLLLDYASTLVFRNTTTTLAADFDPTQYGHPVTFTATVTPGTSTAAPTGTVQWTFDGAPMGAPIALPPSGIVTWTTSTLPIGVHTLSIAYSGDATHFASASPTITHTVKKRLATTAAVAPPASLVYGAPWTLTATVSPENASTGIAPTGTLELMVNGKTLTTGSPAVPVKLPISGGTVTTSDFSITITCTWVPPLRCSITIDWAASSALKTGNNSVRAVYSGDANYTGSTSPAVTQQVKKATPAVVVVADPPTSILVGTPVTLTATVSTTVTVGSLTPASVQFLFDGTNLGAPVTLDPITHRAVFPVTWSLPLGNHSIKARYLGTRNFMAVTSPGIVLTIHS